MSLKQLKLPVAVCAAVIEKNGRYLLTKRPADKKLGGFWEFPGGKIDPGESPHAALKRELREELSIEISVRSVLETVYHHYEWGNVLILAYLCRWESGTIEHLEVADHAWVGPQDFGAYDILAADQPILEKIQQSNSKNRQRTLADE
ncbi:(deoxy)nucleoside triphosphate pyrophosphohydrolase [Malonomonas rubra]|uniref:(deoxy)nucleoside triphosphate pyrophosphohydrolase n=1 Tax=Malonomonas rubra TaxID=57040 RepID=UPI0026EA6281|nr:(deoxy)nucleoside triphosphate pyrophosphohydrolase [Malonomonas rubra]